MKCLLCRQNQAALLEKTQSRWNSKVHKRHFYHCSHCEFVFLDPSQVLTQEEERQRYEIHENDLSQSGYYSFIDEFWNFLAPYLKLGQKGLDLGSGPTPTFVEFAQTKGFTVFPYDPYYSPQKPEGHSFDFIWCHEVFEHIQDSKLFIEEWSAYLKKGGLFAIRTKSLPPLNEFKNWHYHRDHTHISFFSEEGMNTLFSSLGYSTVASNSEMFLFSKIK